MICSDCFQSSNALQSSKIQMLQYFNCVQLLRLFLPKNLWRLPLIVTCVLPFGKDFGTFVCCNTVNTVCRTPSPTVTTTSTAPLFAQAVSPKQARQQFLLTWVSDLLWSYVAGSWPIAISATGLFTVGEEHRELKSSWNVPYCGTWLYRCSAGEDRQRRHTKSSRVELHQGSDTVFSSVSLSRHWKIQSVLEHWFPPKMAFACVEICLWLILKGSG